MQRMDGAQVILGECNKNLFQKSQFSGKRGVGLTILAEWNKCFWKQPKKKKKKKKKKNWSKCFEKKKY